MENKNIDSVNIKDEVVKYLKYWPYILISLALALTFAYLYLKYTTPIYSAATNIIIKDSQDPSEEDAILSQLGFMSATPSMSLENELAILRSKKIMKAVVTALNLRTKYYYEGDIRNVEITADEAPYIAELLSESISSNILYKVYSSSKQSVIVENTETSKKFEGNFGEPISLDIGDVIIYDTGRKEETVLMNFNTEDQIASSLGASLSVGNVGEGSTIIILKILGPVNSKNRAILNQLVLEYNKDAIEDNNIIARNTSEFINERLSLINFELDSIENDIESFKEQNEIVNIESASENIMSNYERYEQQIEETQIQKSLAESLLVFMRDKKDKTLPANLGFEDEGISNLIEQHNQLVLERNRILVGSTEENPLVKNLNEQLIKAKNNLIESLERYLDNLNLFQSEYNSRFNEAQSQLSMVPNREREYREVARQQTIKEQLYLFLLQRREENSIAYGVETPKAKVVDEAYSLGRVTPKITSVYLGACFAGLIIPFLIIFGKNFMNNKVESKSDLNGLSDISVAGEIPRVPKGEDGIFAKNDRSVVAESFRLLVSNLQYLLVSGNNPKKSLGSCIFVTSTVKGEGKTFCSFNLALTLREGGKKVLLIGADLRNPQLQRYEEEATSGLGLSDYFVNSDLSVSEITRFSKKHDDLSYITSGSIPPNPSELLKSERVSLLFSEVLNQYDFIVVDTAPSMLVADTFLINNYADITLYVVRSGFTDKNLLNNPIEYKRTGKLNNISFVLNDVKLNSMGYYGYKYGYSYEYGSHKKKKNLLHRLNKKKLNNS